MNEIEMLRARIKSLEDQANYVPEDPLKCFTCYWNDYDRADAVWCNCKGCPKNPKN